MKKPLDVFTEYLEREGLNVTSQRLLILDTFIKSQKHMSLDELFIQVNGKDPSIGRTTVYRTLKLIHDSGIASEVDFGDKITRYEVEYGHGHHDHLVCIVCGNFHEVLDPKIEDLQMKMADKHGFKAVSHRLKIFGICKKCMKKKKGKKSG